MNNSKLEINTDTAETHVISAILHIDDDSFQPWPLYFEDNYYREHDIIFNPGDMLLYESVRCRHGRPKPFKGKYYRNMCVHYKMYDWDDRLSKIKKMYNISF